jgi:hypothetical protein
MINNCIHSETYKLHPLACSLLYHSSDKITIYLEGSVSYVSGYCLLYCHHSILWHLYPVCQGLREVVAMLDIIVGLIGVVLIIYLLATVIRPELF